MTTKALCGVVAAVLGIVVACALGSAVIVGGVAAACTVAGRHAGSRDAFRQWASDSGES